MISAKHWQQSFSGKVVNPRLLMPEQVTYADIPHALAQKIRFNGQCTVMGYTVAQHCVLGAEQLIREGQGSRLALAFLLHEVDEVYLPDVPSPLKGFLSVASDTDGAPGMSWHQLCAEHNAAIHIALKTPVEVLKYVGHPVVKDCDLRMLMTEKRDLMGPEPHPWGFEQQPYDFRIIDIWDPVWAEEQFDRAYQRLLVKARSRKP